MPVSCLPVAVLSWWRTAGVPQAIASVVEASAEDYEATLRAAEAVKAQWMEVRHHQMPLQGQ